MIQVTRAEADVLREKAPSAHIAIVNRGHRNKKYYAEESREAKRVIGELRGTWKPREEKWKRRPRRSPAQQQWSK